jgi:uncharacterized surface protein with fasciclin (FAS1) repeats
MVRNRFGPNSPAYGAGFTGLNGLTALEKLSLLKYSIVPEVFYSTNLTDKVQFETVDKLPISVHVKKGETFINNAKVTMTDYLTSNGVLHLMNMLLLPNSTTATP